MLCWAQHCAVNGGDHEKRNDRCGGSYIHEDARRGGEVYAGIGRQRSLRGKANRSRLPWILILQSFLAWTDLHLWLFG